MDLDQNGLQAEAPGTSSPNGQAPSSPPDYDGSDTRMESVLDGSLHSSTVTHKTTPEAQTPTTMRPDVDPEAFKAAGNRFFRIKDYGKAIDEYSKAIEADPFNPIYLSNRSAAYMSASRFREALGDVKLADELDPGNTKILLRLARILTALGRPAESLDVYAKIEPPVAAKDKAPAVGMQTYVQQAEDSLNSGTAGSMALHALDQAEKGLGAGVEKPRKWRLLMGEAYLKMGNPNALGDAQSIAMSLLRSNNQDPEALVLRGRALYAQGDNDKALQHFRQALNCDPDFKDAVKYLRMVQRLDKTKEEGNAAFKAGRYQESVNLYGSALEIDPSNKTTNSKILQNRAMASIRVCPLSSCLTPG